MSELSKTARASAVKEKREARIETPEESIRQLRLNLDSGLYVTPDRIQALVDAFDRERDAVKALAEATAGLLKRAEAAEEIVTNLKTRLLDHVWVDTLESGKSYRVMRVHDEVSIELIDDDGVAGSVTLEQATEGVFHPEPPFEMAAIPAQEHDEHHLVDFGHHVTHPTSEGA